MRKARAGNSSFIAIFLMDGKRKFYKCLVIEHTYLKNTQLSNGFIKSYYSGLQQPPKDICRFQDSVILSKQDHDHGLFVVPGQ